VAQKLYFYFIAPITNVINAGIWPSWHIFISETAEVKRRATVTFSRSSGLFVCSRIELVEFVYRFQHCLGLEINYKGRLC
jgi:hypothetical protein